MWLGATYQEQDDILTSPRYWSEFPVDISIHLLAFAQIAGSSRQRPWISHLSLWSSPVWAACGEEIFAGVQNGWGRFLPPEGLRTEGSACPCVCVMPSRTSILQLGVESSSRGSGERKFIFPQRLAIQSGVILASLFSLLPDHVLTVYLFQCLVNAKPIYGCEQRNF